MIQTLNVLKKTIDGRLIIIASRNIRISDRQFPAVMTAQPFQVAEVFTGHMGKLVPLKETIKGFQQILAGEYDHLPEQAFYMVGPIEEAVAKADKLAEEHS